jgi:hypothetical protein
MGHSIRCFALRLPRSLHRAGLEHSFLCGSTRYISCLYSNFGEKGWDRRAERRRQQSVSRMFKILGVLVAVYVAHGFVTGEIYGRSRAWGRTFRRDEEPWKYWSAIISYSLLAIALFFVFGSRQR